MTPSEEGPYILPLSAESVTDHVGGKAGNLSRLQAFGVRVPETLVLQCAALRHTLETSGLLAPAQEYLGLVDSVVAGTHVTRREVVAVGRIGCALHGGETPPLRSCDVYSGTAFSLM